MTFEAISAFLFNRDNFFAFLAAITCFAAIVTLSSPLMKNRRFEARLKGVASQRERLRRQSRAAIASDGRRGLRQDPKGWVRDIVERLKLEKMLEDPALADKLLQAGLRGKKPIFAFYFARAVMPIAMFVFALLYLFLVNDLDKSPMMRLTMSMGAAVLGLYLPSMYLSNLAQKRRTSIMGVFPDALDLLLICVEAGMSIEAAFQKVANEVGASSIELAEELSLLSAELSYLQDRRIAYENLGRRTNHPGVKAVVTALIQAERYGTPLGNSLRVMAKENRELRLAAAEKKAAALPAKLTVPMIVFFLPVLFVVILGPSIIRFQASGIG